MNSYAIYRIAETMRLLLFMTASILIFNFYPVTAIMVVLLALLNDLPIMMIAYDNAPIAPQPVRWDMTRVLTIASVLGGYGVLESFGLFWIVRDYFALSQPVVQALIFLKLLVSGHMTIYLTRNKGPVSGASLAKLEARRSRRGDSVHWHPGCCLWLVHGPDAMAARAHGLGLHAGIIHGGERDQDRHLSSAGAPPGLAIQASCACRTSISSAPCPCDLGLSSSEARPLQRSAWPSSGWRA